MNTKVQEALVSIIIPTYNRPTYLREAIKSAVQQTYRNIEIIVSDNCSSENPLTIVESFQDQRIRFSRNEINLGMFSNTMKAFRQARGKYVASLLDDDMWNEEFLEKLVPPLEAKADLAIAFCDHYVIDADGKIDYSATEQCSRFYKRHDLKEGVYQPFCELGLVHQAVSPATAAVIRKNVIDWNNIPPEVEGLWDLYLTYLCCRSGRGAYYYPAKLTRYRNHSQTETVLSGRKDFRTKIRKAKAGVFCYERFMEDEKLQEFKPYFNQKLLHANTTLGVGLLRANQVAEARSCFLHVLRQRFSLRTMAALILSFSPQRIACRF